VVKLAASTSAGDRAVLFVRLHELVPRNSRFPVEAVARFLEILREQPIDEAKLADRFARIVQEHGRLEQELRPFPWPIGKCRRCVTLPPLPCRAHAITTKRGPNWRRGAI
jgi:hypothetical protein